MRRTAITEIKLPKASMTSLTDIIFQLLIYFLVTMAMGTVQRRATISAEAKEAQALLELPKVEKLQETTEKFQGFLIHITTGKKGPLKGKWIGYVLDEEVSTIDDAEKDTINFAHGPWELRIAKAKLQKRIEDAIFLSGGKKPQLTIRAAEKTEFGEILDILEFCDKDSITQVTFRFIKER
ncbi:MAG: ExbD/TolR family protein [bacterium]